MKEPKEPKIDIFPEMGIIDKILPYALAVAFGAAMLSALICKILELHRSS